MLFNNLGSKPTQKYLGGWTINVVMTLIGRLSGYASTSTMNECAVMNLGREVWVDD